MQSIIKKVGNSARVLVPRRLLAEIGAGVGDRLDVRVERDRIVIEKIRADPREGWEEAAAAIAAYDSSQRAFADFPNEDDEREWTW